MSSRHKLRVITSAIGVLLAISAMPPMSLSQTPVQPVSPEAMEAIYAARADSARGRFSAADVEFVSAMIHHHAQALTMSEMAPTHGASPTIRTLAARIINGQRDEIATMQRWLSERGQPVPEVAGIGGADHTEHGAGAPEHAEHMAAMGHGADAQEHAEHMAAMGHDADAQEHAAAGAGAASHDGHASDASADHAGMPGMLTPAQMARLDAARGEEFDQLYLASMIMHHEGAVTMVEELFATDGALQDIALFKLASDIQAEQRSEIERMSLMLEELTGSPLGPALIEVQ